MTSITDKPRAGDGLAYREKTMSVIRSFSSLVTTALTPFPLALCPGAALTGVRVRQLVTDARAQFEAAAALHERLRLPIVITAMDPSAEAEAFGSQIYLLDREMPIVADRLIADVSGIDRLSIPAIGDKRTRVHLDAARLLTSLTGHPLVLGMVMGPFSLAACLFGVGEATDLIDRNPDAMHRLLDKVTQFLIAYSRAFKDAGADGLIIVEPTAGFLPPSSLAAFSSAYVRQIQEAIETPGFELVLHNCAAQLKHLTAMLASGVTRLHVSNSTDIISALCTLPENIILCGNLDPIAVFVEGTPNVVSARTRALMDAATGAPNFVPSSGCDLPAETPLENLSAFVDTVRGQTTPA
jgi:uroporphyrinogen decarboxylase